MTPKQYIKMRTKLLEIVAVDDSDNVLLVPGCDDDLASTLRDDSGLFVHCTTDRSVIHELRSHDDEAPKEPVTNFALWHTTEIQRAKMVHFDVAVYWPCCRCVAHRDVADYGMADWTAISAMLDFNPGNLYGLIPTSTLDLDPDNFDKDVAHVLRIIRDQEQFEHFNGWSLFSVTPPE